MRELSTPGVLPGMVLRPRLTATLDEGLARWLTLNIGRVTQDTGEQEQNEG